MLCVTAPLYTDDLLHTLESMIFTTAFCSVGGTSAEGQKIMGQLELLIFNTAMEIVNVYLKRLRDLCIYYCKQGITTCRVGVYINIIL